jgi:hypothetical protein
VAHAGLHAVTFLHFLAAQAVAVVKDIEQRLILQFRALVFHDARNVFIAQGFSGGRYLGHIIVFHVFGQQV